MLAQAEFALGEFATFELAKESRAYAVPADLAAHGTATAAPAGSSTLVSSGALTSSGAGAFAGRGGALAHGRLSSAGRAESALLASYFAGADLGAAGASTSALRSAAFAYADSAMYGASANAWAAGRGISVELHAAGSAEASFEYLNEPQYRIKGFSTVSWATGATVNVDFTTSSAAQFKAAGQADAWGNLEATGWTFTNLVGQSYGQSALSARSACAALWPAQALAHSGLASAGVAAVDLLAQARASGAFAAAGSAEAAYATAYVTRRYASLAAAGSAAVTVETLPLRYNAATLAALGVGRLSGTGNTVVHGHLSAAGTSGAAWRKGHQILASMPPAFATVQRPAEARSAERPAEIRSVEKSQ